MRHDGLDAGDSLLRKNRPKFFSGTFSDEFFSNQILFEPIFSSLFLREWR